MSTIPVSARPITDEAYRSLVAPRSVAIIGANDNRDAFTGGSIANLVRHEYPGTIYPVNPRREVVQDLAAYPSVSDIPDTIDSAVLVVRGDLVTDTLIECEAKGAKSAIVVASGFGEGAAGDAGRQRRAEFDSWLTEHPLLILGPSTTGLVNINDRYVPRAVTNQLDPEFVRPGPIALISQSGASNNVAYNRAQAAGVGIGLGIATGVQANFTIWDAAGHALADPAIGVVAVIAEQLGSPGAWLPVCEQADRLGKAIVLLKAGRTSAGGHAVATHTGSLAGNWPAQSASLRDAGVYLVNDLDQLWEVAQIVNRFGHGPGRPARLGVIGFSGGEGALIADLAEEAGHELPAVSETFAGIVNDRFTLAGASNPFDPTGEIVGRPEDAAAVFDSFLRQPNIDAFVVAMNAQGGERRNEIAEQLVERIAEQEVATVLSTWSVANMSESFDAAVRAKDLAWFDGSHRAVDALSVWARRLPAQPDAELVAVARTPAQAPTYAQARDLLSSMGVPFADHRVVDTADEAVIAASELGFPIVVKSNVGSDTHKADLGLVKIGLGDGDAVRSAADEILQTGAGSVVVEPQVGPGIEVIVGAVHEPEAGEMLVIGTGGSLTESLADVALIPVRAATRQRILAALQQTSAGTRVAANHQAVTEILATAQAVAALALAGWSAEVNPLIVNDHETLAVDARLEQAVWR